MDKKPEMNIEIVYPSAAFVLDDLFTEGRGHGLLYKDKQVIFFVGRVDGEIVGVGGVRVFTPTRRAVFKGDYTKPSHRGRGYLTQITKARIEYLKKNGIRTIEANCTEMSVNIHLKAGARLIKKMKHLYLIRYENI